MEYADIETTDSPYRVLKMINGEDVLCKVLQEYSDAFVVEVPMVVTKTKVYDKPNHLVEHTGLQKWMNFTNDVKFIISKEKLLGTATLSHEVTLYYKMLANRIIEESTNEPMDDDEVLMQLRDNMDRLAELIEESEPKEDEYEYTESKEDKKILH